MAAIRTGTGLDSIRLISQSISAINRCAMDRQPLRLQQIYSKTLLQVEISVRPEAATLRYQLGDFAVVIIATGRWGAALAVPGRRITFPTQFVERVTKGHDQVERHRPRQSEGRRPVNTPSLRQRSARSAGKLASVTSRSRSAAMRPCATPTPTLSATASRSCGPPTISFSAASISPIPTATRSRSITSCSTLWGCSPEGRADQD
jgi:hypothetical protein